jgi:hypothetical protein
MSKIVDPVRVQGISAGRERLRTPRAAALAGILFAVMFSISLVIIRLALPESLSEANAATWLGASAGTLSIALTLVPFSGIAFLWFIGVMRDRLGSLEDQLISTVLLGSGLLFLGMVFVSAAIAGGVIASYDMAGKTMVESSVLNFGRAVTYTVMNVYAVRMAGVFMISSGTLWIRTGIMPRGLALLTYGLALLLLLAPSLSIWITLAFPVWVFIISIFILVKRPMSAVAPDGRLTGVKEG